MFYFQVSESEGRPQWVFQPMGWDLGSFLQLLDLRPPITQDGQDGLHLAVRSRGGEADLLFAAPVRILRVRQQLRM